ncbi:MAG: hypothetical protein K8M05_25280, partial [Deltaproteobacteria bacterium]|nr:hypothetical protein [Kofleriaceae bacterium]
GAVSAIARRDGVFDRDAVATLMASGADPAAPCAHVAEIGARGRVTYADLVAVMDVAVGAGRVDLALVGGSTAPYPRPRRRPGATSPADAEAELAKRLRGPDLGSAPVIVIATSSLSVRLIDGGVSREVVIDDAAPLGDDAALTFLHETLRDAHEPGNDTLILQADRATPAEVVVDSFGAARAAGFGHVLFAVKRAGAP